MSQPTALFLFGLILGCLGVSITSALIEPEPQEIAQPSPFWMIQTNAACPGLFRVSEHDGIPDEHRDEKSEPGERIYPPMKYAIYSSYEQAAEGTRLMEDALKHIDAEHRWRRVDE